MCRGVRRPIILVLVTIAAARLAAAATLEVYPKEIRLDNARDLQRVLVVSTGDDGFALDVTLQAQVTVEPEGIAEWTAEGRLKPLGDGDATLRIVHEGVEVGVPVRVQQAGVTPPMSFRNDIEPVLMRAGCNTGACHGSARGQNGFRLTLFGYDPAFDYLSLTRQERGRRMNVALPDESLMLLKATGQVDHMGGTVFSPESSLYATLRQWIAEGATDDPGDVPALTGIQLFPKTCVLSAGNAKQPFLVQASYADGTDRDVTDLAILSSSDDLTVAMGEGGVASAADRGEAYIMARFGTFAEVAQVIVVPADAAFTWPDVASRGYIDDLIFAKLKHLREAPAEPCDDATFLRRAYLDILGTLPTIEETRTFIADANPEKRTAAIDALLQRPEFSDLWAMKWAELLQVRTTTAVDRKGMHRYNDWLRQAIQSNEPVSEWVSELLTASGGNFTSPAANFYLLQDQPTLMAENVAQVFLGIQMQCAQCHNHPFDRWTMDDYYSFAAFFAQVGRKGSSDPREQVVFNKGSGEVTNLRTGQPIGPSVLGGGTPDLAGRDRREVLAQWLTSPENPWFARNIVNRVWHHFMGRGIVEPVDDVRVSNPPSHPELLDMLAAKLIEYNYDQRKLIRDICTSYTYQQSTRPRDPAVSDVRNFAHAAIRRLPAEQLLDAISKVTQSHVKFPALPLGARAVQVADAGAGSYFLEVFGRPARESACTCDRRDEPTLAQTLHLINGETITQAINAPGGRLEQIVAAGIPAEQAIEELYLASFCRAPTDEERQKLAEYVAQATDVKSGLEDVFWSVLNSQEFVFNH